MTPSPSGLSVVRSVRLVNPNSNAAATERMVAAARAVAPRWLSIVGETTVASPSLIVDAAGAEMAEAAVVDAARRHPGHGDGVILSAYIDPGIGQLRELLDVPVVGIGEASMAEAAAIGRFSIVMTTPGLVGIVCRYAAALGLADRLVSVPSTTEEPNALMADPERTQAALDELIRQAVRQDGAEAVVVGGGPLADAARALAPTSPVPLIEPVPAAVRRLLAMLSAAGAR